VLQAGEVSEAIDTFGDPLLTWPIASIDAVTYRDVDGIEQTLPSDVWWADIGSRPGRIVGLSPWPCPARAITVTMQAGYADGAVPALALQAIKIILAEYYANRAAGDLSLEAERAVKWSLRSFKRRTL